MSNQTNVSDEFAKKYNNVGQYRHPELYFVYAEKRAFGS